MGNGASITQSGTSASQAVGRGFDPRLPLQSTTYAPNHGQRTVKRNRVACGDTLAVLFCPASNGKLFGVTIDRADLERVQAKGFWRVANLHGFCGRFDLYCYTVVNRKNVYLHRFLMDAPAGKVVDHRHHRTLDNRKSQLRVCSQGDNLRNRRPFKINRKKGAA